MRYTITVKPNAKHPKVQVISENKLAVSVDVTPIEGKANKRVCEILAKHFGIAKSNVKILHGEKGRSKVVEILGSVRK